MNFVLEKRMPVIIKLAMIVGGGFLAFMGFQEFKVSKGTAGGPAAVDLAALESGSVEVTNPHVKVGPHMSAYWDCIYEYEQSKYDSGEPGPDAKVNYVYYPIISVEHPYVGEVAAFQEKYAEVDQLPADALIPKISAPAIVVKTNVFKTIGEIPNDMLKTQALEGLVINRIASLKSEEEDLLRQGFGNFNAEKVLILEEGRKPASKGKSFGIMGGGGVLILLGILWLFAGGGRVKGLGGFLVLASIISAVLSLIGRQLIFFTWIDNWGATIEWIIQGAILVLGLILFFVGAKSDKELEA